MAEEKAADGKVSVRTVFREAPFIMTGAEREVLRVQGLLHEPGAPEVPERAAPEGSQPAPDPAPDPGAAVKSKADGKPAKEAP